MNRVLGANSLPARVVVIIDKITSENTFELLRQVSLLDESRIFFFGIVKQNAYMQWSQETRDNIESLGFESKYIPCLWEEETNFIQKLLRQLDSQEKQTDKLAHFRDHIAFVTRGAPGEAIHRILGTEYCTYSQGMPKLSLESIKDWDRIEYNAYRQKLLARNWDRLLGNQFTGAEERDQARLGVYELLDWIDREAGFNWAKLKTVAHNSRVPISPSGLVREETAKELLDVLIAEGYLIEFREKKTPMYRVARRTRYSNPIQTQN
jgi:hypothetical protein